MSTRGSAAAQRGKPSAFRQDSIDDAARELSLARDHLKRVSPVRQSLNALESGTAATHRLALLWMLNQGGT